jgi:uncharacterized membrane protein
MKPLPDATTPGLGIMLAASFALIGALIALYLLLHSLGVSSLTCPIAGCDKVQASEYSRFLGVPVAAYGLTGFTALLAIAVAGLWTSSMFGVPIITALRLGAAFGLLAYAPLTYLELFVIHAVCFWCVTSSVMMLGVLISTLIAPPTSVESTVQSLI